MNKIPEKHLLMYALDFLYDIERNATKLNDGTGLSYTIHADTYERISIFLRENYGINRPLTAEYNPVMDIEVGDFVPSEYSAGWDPKESPREIAVLKSVNFIDGKLAPEITHRLFYAHKFICNGNEMYRWLRTE